VQTESKIVSVLCGIQRKAAFRIVLHLLSKSDKVFLEMADRQRRPSYVCVPFPHRRHYAVRRKSRKFRQLKALKSKEASPLSEDVTWGQRDSCSSVSRTRKFGFVPSESFLDGFLDALSSNESATGDYEVFDSLKSGPPTVDCHSDARDPSSSCATLIPICDETNKSEATNTPSIQIETISGGFPSTPVSEENENLLPVPYSAERRKAVRKRNRKHGRYVESVL
ncbi:hypothetical protein QYM36_016990, partial [Artemia franciscana]